MSDCSSRRKFGHQKGRRHESWVYWFGYNGQECGGQCGAADSFVLSHDVPSIFAGHYDPSFPIALCLKDLGLIQELMDKVGTTNTLTEATHERFREAGRRYGVAAGEMTACKVIEDDAGIDLRVAGDWVKPWEVKHS